jgi:hypothetical protein
MNYNRTLFYLILKYIGILPSKTQLYMNSMTQFYNRVTLAQHVSAASRPSSGQYRIYKGIKKMADLRPKHVALM